MTSCQVQIKLVTKQPEYAVAESVYSVSGCISVKELNSLVNSLLKDPSPENYTDVDFDFLLLGELIRLPIEEHISTKNISTEEVLDIEYFLKYPTPSPESSLNHDDWVSGVRASEKWILSGCYDATVHIWGIDGEHKLTIPGHTAAVKSVAWIKTGSPVSSFVSTSHDETAMLWQWNHVTNAVDCIHICKGHARSVDCVHVNSSKDKFATGSYDQMLKIWSAEDECESVGGDDDKKRFKSDGNKSKVKTPLMTLNGHTDGITGLQWIDSNEVCTCSFDNTLKIWDIELGGLKAQLNGSKSFMGISYSPLSRLLISASTDKHVRLWDPRTKDGSLVKAVYSSHRLWVTSVHWSPVDAYQFVSGSYDTMVKLWDTRSPKTPLFELSGHEEKVLAVDWSQSQWVVSGGADNYLRIFKTKIGELSKEMEL